MGQDTLPKTILQETIKMVVTEKKGECRGRTVTAVQRCPGIMGFYLVRVTTLGGVMK